MASRWRSRAGRAALVALVLGLAGCGGGRDETADRPSASATPAPPDVVRFCSAAGTGWRPVSASAGKGPIAAASVGSGPGVVLLNESDNDPCAWTAEAHELARAGYRAVVFRYGISDDETASTREALALADAVRGAGKAQLMGASIGGRMVFAAAARAPRRLAAIVSLSGERAVLNLPDLLPVVRRVRIPVLYVGSREDPYTEGVRQPRQLQAALASRDARFRLVAGAEHGVLLLGGASGPVLRQQIRAFLDAHR